MMTQFVSSLSGSKISSRHLSALAAVAFGVLLLAGAGFAGSQALHEGTHDTRHAFGLPCH
jgi:cobalt transporter subunit CbtB